MTRDRLEELRKISGISYIDDVDVLPIAVEAENSNIDDILGRYVEVRKKLEALLTNKNEMQKNLQTASLRHLKNEEMENLRQSNASLGHQLIAIFRDLKANLPENDDYSLEARIKRTLFYGMHQEYINILDSQEEILRNYEAKLIKNLKLHSRIMNYKHSEEEIEELISKRQTSLFTDNIIEETEKERKTLRDLLERYNELEKLERSIVEVHTLFLNVQNLIIEQSDRIQIVEYHAEQASKRVDKGADKLDQAEKLNIKNLKCKTILIISAIIIFIILVLLAFVL